MTEAGEIVVERDLMVSARDGVLLATDVCRPEGPSPFPVLLERTQYDKSAASDPSAPPLQKPTHLAPRRVCGSDRLDVLNAADSTPLSSRIPFWRRSSRAARW
jgi:predicted acyl esterase